jgi:hypothetical protein
MLRRKPYWNRKLYQPCRTSELHTEVADWEALDSPHSLTASEVTALPGFFRNGSNGKIAAGDRELEKSQENNSMALLGTERICNECVHEHFLSAQIGYSRVSGTCSYCSAKRAATITIEQLGNYIDNAFQAHYKCVIEEPDPFDFFAQFARNVCAVPVIDAIKDAAGIPHAAACDLQIILEKRYQSRSSQEIGEQTAYASDSFYEKKGITDSAWREEWSTFEHDLKHKARFFNQAGADLLTRVFADIEQLQVRDAGNLVVDAGPGTNFSQLYRARVFRSEEQLKEALKAPEKHIGPPPSKLAAAGRMNARGISVFYGADSPPGAIVEVRPPVDLTALSRLDRVERSIFDKNTLPELERIAFLSSLQARMTKPVMPDDHEIEYLVTQTVADFLATESAHGFDGIIFTSVQTTQSNNVVLFQHSSRVEEVLRNTPASFFVSTEDWDDDSNDLTTAYEVVEKIGRSSPASKSASPVLFSRHNDTREFTLRLAPETTFVHHIEAVTYASSPYRVTQRIIEEDEDISDF